MRKMALMLILLLTVAIFDSQCLGDTGVVRKNLGDINGDGKKEIAVEKSTCGSMFFTDVKIQTNNTTILVLPTLCGDSADGYKIIGKQIVVWRGDWYAESSKWKPHYYDFTWYRWNAKKKAYTIIQESKTLKSYDYENAQRSMPLLAQKPGKSLAIKTPPSKVREQQSSKTIEGAVKSYGLSHQSPGWAKLPYQLRFKFKKISGQWASVYTYVVNPKGQMEGEYCTYLLKRTAKNWMVVRWSDECSLSPKIVKELGIPVNVVKKLGWSIYDDMPL